MIHQTASLNVIQTTYGMKPLKYVKKKSILGNTQATLHAHPLPLLYEHTEHVVPLLLHYELTLLVHLLHQLYEHGEHVVSFADDEPKQEHVRQQVELKLEAVLQHPELKPEQLYVN